MESAPAPSASAPPARGVAAAGGVLLPAGGGGRAADRAGGGGDVHDVDVTPADLPALPRREQRGTGYDRGSMRPRLESGSLASEIRGRDNYNTIRGRAPGGQTAQESSQSSQPGRPGAAGAAAAIFTPPHPVKNSPLYHFISDLLHKTNRAA
jgi:hypothetical protein